MINLNGRVSKISDILDISSKERKTLAIFFGRVALVSSLAEISSGKLYLAAGKKAFCQKSAFCILKVQETLRRSTGITPSIR